MTARRCEGRIAVVTAAANGIGRATAARLARDGATIVAVDIADLEHARRAVVAEGGACDAVVLDVTVEHDVQRVFAEIESRHGRIDILVNGVGNGARERSSEFFESVPDTWHRVVQSSLVSALLCARQVVPGMRARRYGKIVNVSSTVWMQPPPRMVDFSAAKAGLIGFTRGLAIELAELGVTVNTVAPGVTNTRALANVPPEILARNIAEIPMRRMAEPEDVAHAIAFLASDEAGFITGQHLAVSGGRGLH